MWKTGDEKMRGGVGMSVLVLPPLPLWMTEGEGISTIDEEMIE